MRQVPRVILRRINSRDLPFTVYVSEYTSGDVWEFCNSKMLLIETHTLLNKEGMLVQIH